MFRSSIFSSESLQIDWREPRWRAAAQALALAAIILVAGELTCRLLLKDVGRRWEYWHPVAATKFEFVRDHIDRRTPIRTLLVGDSTGAADLDPAVFEQMLGGTAWNAAWAGNFPLAFEGTTMPLIEDPNLQVDVIVASFIPSGFSGRDRPSPSEASIISSTYVQKLASVRQTGDYFHLARFRSAWPFLLTQFTGRTQPDLVVRFGYEPLHGHATSRALEREPPLESVSAGLSQRRFEVMRRLIGAARQKKAILVAVIPPSLTQLASRLENARQVRSALDVEAARGDVVVLDFLRAQFLTREDFVDLNHLNAEGAARMSQEIARAVGAACGCGRASGVAQKSWVLRK